MAYVFFLGGHDAEMCEIRNILIHHEQNFFDKELAWGAKASDYKEEMQKVGNDIPVLIELEIDIPLPEKAIIVDHHGPKSGKNKKTSIEQVADLLNVSLNRYQQLIAANDRGWIDGLLEAGATEKEIEVIRSIDRYCQGVTDEEEAAEEVIKKMKVKQGMAIVEYPYKHVSPVMDRLYGKYDNILFIASESINLSGDGALVLKLKDRFPQCWYGGNLPEKGFWGMKRKGKEISLYQILKIIEENYG